jgi:hypothetical protein
MDHRIFTFYDIILSEDIRHLINSHISLNDYRSIVTCASTLNKHLSEELRDRKLLCIRGIEDKWNKYTPYLEVIARNHNKSTSYRCEMQYDGCCNWFACKTGYISCIYCSFAWGDGLNHQCDVTHTVRVEYGHNPMDVDIVSWYLDDKHIGYTML